MMAENNLEGITEDSDPWPPFEFKGVTGFITALFWWVASFFIKTDQ